MGCTSFQACLGVPGYDSTCGSKIRSRPRRGGTSFAGEIVLRGTFRHAKFRLIWRSLRSQISPKSSQVLVTPRRHRAERMTTSLAVQYIDGKLWGWGARHRSLGHVAFDFVVVNRSFRAPPVEMAAVWHRRKKSRAN